MLNSPSSIGRTTTSVARLHELWRAGLPGAASLTTTPIVSDGTIYVAGGSGRVFAVDAASGRLMWTSEATGTNIGPFGVAVDRDRVYALDGSAGVVALDRANGHRLWATDVTATDTTGIDIQPIVVDGLDIARAVGNDHSGIPLFVSLVPTQLHRIVADPDQAAALARCHTVLVGGGAMDRALRDGAREAGINVVATYG